ncbi:MAG: septum formation initiator family protein [Bacilli bacterium]|nr:septum formation initiator family protein [Bacilli bacterium]MBQ6539023.1 septum formation initiator family protein [Bacilli bacterium]
MARSKTRKKKLRQKPFVYVVCLFVLCVFAFDSFKYCESIFTTLKEKKELTTKLSDLKSKEKELELDANKLQNSDYIARYAREKYFYSKDGELVIKIPEEE